MKVLHLISSGGYYGAENMLVTLTRALIDLGCECSLGVFSNSHSRHTEIVDYARQAHIDVTTIPCEGRLDFKAADQIRRMIRAQRAEIVHTHGYKADMYGYLAARATRSPVVATCHNWPGRTLVLRLYESIDRRLLAHFDEVVAVSDSVAESLRRTRAGTSDVRVIYNGVDLQRFAESRLTPDHVRQIDATRLVGMVSRLVPGKGAHSFIRVAREVSSTFPDVRFVLVGEGPMRAELERFASSLSMDQKIVFAGVRTDMPNVYASLSIVVLPSMNEGMPMCILEALAARRPVIATAVGAIPDVIQHGRTGILIKPCDDGALRDAIVQLLENPALARNFASQGFELVSERFSAAVMARSYRDLYMQVVAQRTTAHAA